jgi:hypothetical protein
MSLLIFLNPKNNLQNPLDEKYILEQEEQHLKKITFFCHDKGNIKVPGVESTILDEDNDMDEEDDLNDQPAWDIGFEAI